MMMVVVFDPCPSPCRSTGCGSIQGSCGKSSSRSSSGNGRMLSSPSCQGRIGQRVQGSGSCSLIGLALDDIYPALPIIRNIP